MCEPASWSCKPILRATAFFHFLFLFRVFNLTFKLYSVLKCYIWQKQKFSIFLRAKNSAQVVFQSVSAVSKLISLNRF